MSPEGATEARPEGQPERLVATPDDRGPTAERKVYLVIGRSGKPTYGVRAASLEEAVAVNRSHHTGDADLEIREPGRRKAPRNLLVFDASEMAEAVRKWAAEHSPPETLTPREEAPDAQDIPAADGRGDREVTPAIAQAGGQEEEAAPPAVALKTFAVTTPARLAKGSPPIYYVLAGTMGEAEKYVAKAHPLDFQGVVLPHEGPIPKGSWACKARQFPLGDELAAARRSADEPNPTKPKRAKEAPKPPAMAVIETDLERLLETEGEADARRHAKPKRPRKPPKPRAEPGASGAADPGPNDPRDLYQVVVESGGAWHKCHECRGDHDHPAPRPAGGRCHRSRREVLAIKDAPGDWRAAPLWELDLTRGEREGFEQDERIATVGDLHDHLERYGWTFAGQNEPGVLDALAGFKDALRRNHERAEARRAAEAARPGPKKKPRKPPTAEAR